MSASKHLKKGKKILCSRCWFRKSLGSETVARQVLAKFNGISLLWFFFFFFFFLYHTIFILQVIFIL